MNATGDTTKPIVTSFVVQEKGSYKVFLYLSIPELKLKRSLLNFLKFVPSNAHVKVLDFQNHSFTFTINAQTKLYSISIARLPGEIQPECCSIKYQRDGCWITLIKLDSTPWMNKICDSLSPGLDIQEDDDQSPPVSAPPEEVLLKDTDMPPPFNLVPLASSPSSRPTTKKGPAPPPPYSVVPLVPAPSLLAYRNVRHIIRLRIPMERRRLDYQMTAMIFVRVIVFVVLHTPYTIFRIYILNSNISSSDSFGYAINQVISMVFASIQMGVYSLNFYIFLVTSSRYRRQVKYFFIKKCWKSMKQWCKPNRNEIHPAGETLSESGVEIE